MKTRRRQNKRNNKRIYGKTKKGGMLHNMYYDQIQKDLIRLSNEKNMMEFVRECEIFFKNKSTMYMNQARRIWNYILTKKQLSHFFMPEQIEYFTKRFKIINRIQFKKYDPLDYARTDDLSRKPEYQPLREHERLKEIDNNLQAVPAAGGKRKTRKRRKSRKY